MDLPRARWFWKGSSMKVKELIDELKKMDPEKFIVRAGYEGGYLDVSEIHEIRLKLNVNNKWYYGTHEESIDCEPADITAICIG
jgi:hypothetical protein